MNLELQRTQVRESMRSLLAQRAAATASLDAVRANPASTPEQITSATQARDAFDSQIDALIVRETELTAEIDRETAMSALSNRITPEPAASRTGGQAGVLPGTDTSVRVGQEPRAYARENDPSGRMFMRDVGLRHLHGAGAAESNDRLTRHMQEERVERGQYLVRAAGTGAFAGLTVPQYLTESYAPLARAMRPFADACNHHDLPADGMTLNISRITTGTSAALQATENSAVSNTDIDDTLLTINVQTNAGQQTLSRQAVERGTGTEDVTVQDLFRAYATTLDSTLINQGTTGLAASATPQTYTDASPTGPETYAQIIKGQAGVEAVMLDMASGDNIVVMHSRRWYGLQSSMSATFPIISQQGLNGAAGVRSLKAIRLRRPRLQPLHHLPHLPPLRPHPRRPACGARRWLRAWRDDDGDGDDASSLRLHQRQPARDHDRSCRCSPQPLPPAYAPAPRDALRQWPPRGIA